jgi:hypothetical protein
MPAVSYAELDRLGGELLPERAVLGIVSTPFNNNNPGGAGGGSTTVVVSNSGDHGAALSACQATNSPGTPGLLGSLGLGSANPGQSMTCVPAAVTN